MKQMDCIKVIFEDWGDWIQFMVVEWILYEGFVDDILKFCLFIDYQLFDCFYKYNLKSDKVCLGKVVFLLKELNQFIFGDYVVYIDYGVGCFFGLVCIFNGDMIQEVMKLVYQNEDVVFVFIYLLYKVLKYKGKEGEVF